MMDLAFAAFDRLFFGTILRQPKQADIDSIDAAARESRDDPQSLYRDFIYRMMSSVDSKVSALLSHISLIIAALVFIYSSRAGSGASPLVKNMILGEIAAYLVLTVFCLRCIRMTTRLTSSSVAMRWPSNSTSGAPLITGPRM